MPPRIVTRNFANLFRRAQIDITPGPRIAQDIALVSIVEDLSHLVGPILNASGGLGLLVPPVVGERGVFQMEPASGNALRIWEVQNIHATDSFSLNLLPASATFATGPTPQGAGMEWGPPPTHTAVQGNQVAPGGTGLLLVAGTTITFSDNPVVIQPGEFFVLHQFFANETVNAVVTWEEVSD